MILTTIDKFIAVIPTAADVDNFDDVKPYCNSAELWIKNKVLGATLYNFVDALDETPSGTDADLLQLCLNIIGNHAYWDAIPFLDVVHTNAGFGVIQSSNKAPASKERVERLREQCLIRRDNEVENLITFLEQNVAYHEDWKGSPVYSVLTDCLIRTADEMKTYASWEGDRDMFLMLKPKLVHYTMAKLQPVFSKALIDSLIEKQRDNDLSADELSVIVLLKHSLGSLVNENQKVASQIASDALRFIDENVASFTTYTESTEYEARNTTGYINELESPIFFKYILMKALRLKIPTQTDKLNSNQLIFISRLFLMGYSAEEFLIKAFLFLSGLKVFERPPAADGSHWYKYRKRKKPFIIDTDVLAKMSEKCRYLLETGEIKPIRWINFARARHYRLYNAKFDEYLMAENYYFAYIHTNDETHLNNLVAVLYRRPWHWWNSDKIQKRSRYFRKVDPAVKNSVFMWYVGFRNMVPKRCPNLFSGKKASGKFSIREYINGMIHQLNNADITQNKKLLKQPLWSALDELEQRALDAVRSEEAMNKKS